VKRFPPAVDVPFEEAVVRQLTALDKRITPARILDRIAGRREDDVRRALLATARTRPDDVEGYFTASLGPAVRREAAGRDQDATTPLRSVEDPYAT
jgi:hypothetical protein